MKLHLNRPAGRNAFTGYGQGYVLVNGVRYESSVLVAPEVAVTPWEVEELQLLRADQVTHLSRLKVEVLLVGTGERLRFPPPELLQPLTRAGIGVEIMDTPAACRTYNILMAEGRKIAAALII